MLELAERGIGNIEEDYGNKLDFFLKVLERLPLEKLLDPKNMVLSLRTTDPYGGSSQLMIFPLSLYRSKPKEQHVLEESDMGVLQAVSNVLDETLRGQEELIKYLDDLYKELCHEGP